MTLPLDHTTVLLRYQKKHQYYDEDLVSRAYSRMFNRFMMGDGLGFGIASTFTMYRPPTEEEIEALKKKTFADRIDDEIEAMKAEGLKRYLYKCEQCYCNKTVLLTDKEIADGMLTNVRGDFDAPWVKAGKDSPCKCGGTLKVVTV